MTVDEARELMESLRWPNGAVCPHCGGDKPYRLKPQGSGKNPARKGLYKCRSCKRQFSVTVRTIFAGAHSLVHALAATGIKEWSQNLEGQREIVGPWFKNYQRADFSRLNPRESRVQFWPFSSADDITAAINDAVPKGLNEYFRQEVCQEIALRMLEGEELSTRLVQANIRLAYRNYPIMAGWMRSLDETIPGTNSLKRIDTIANDARHF